MPGRICTSARRSSALERRNHDGGVRLRGQHRDNGEDAFPGLYCGTTSDNAIDIEGNGGDDTIEPASGNFADANVHPLTSVLIDGGAGNDTISTFPTVTTPGASLTFNGGDGNDTINAMDVSCPAANPPTLAISGDAGDDILTGSAFGCNSVIHGGDGNDTINGNSGTDQLFGDAGNDSITGGSGAVTMDGGPGTDSLSAGNDVLHPTNDTFDAVDGERDTITCGFGADIANIDQFDIVPSPASPNACEQVNVTQVGGTTPTPTPSPPCRCVLPPTTKLRRHRARYPLRACPENACPGRQGRLLGRVYRGAGLRC